MRRGVPGGQQDFQPGQQGALAVEQFVAQVRQVPVLVRERRTVGPGSRIVLPLDEERGLGEQVVVARVVEVQVGVHHVVDVLRGDVQLGQPEQQTVLGAHGRGQELGERLPAPGELRVLDVGTVHAGVDQHQAVVVQPDEVARNRRCIRRPSCTPGAITS